ncbi:C-type lectin galactose-binding isoform-like [Panulirus ornatus]|uniref:C-type lectin galactose-binding isoform-like n=1 Tax=Panulirus ornatus TaxID=150431 RepID=UPI003A8577B1
MRLVLSLVAALLATAAAEDCPDNFILIGFGCYSFPSFETTWDDANEYCKFMAPPGTIGGLAHIEDCTQHANLWKHIEAQPDGKVNYWIGGKDEEEEGTFRWVSTGFEIPSEVPFWYPHQPDGWTSENALSLSKTGYFADESESLLQKFICQLL